MAAIEKAYSTLNLGCIINLQHESGNSRAIKGSSPQSWAMGIGLAPLNPANAAYVGNLDLGLKRPYGRFNGVATAEQNGQQPSPIYPALALFLSVVKNAAANTNLLGEAFLSLRLSLICVYGVICACFPVSS